MSGDANNYGIEVPVVDRDDEFVIDLDIKHVLIVIGAVALATVGVGATLMWVKGSIEAKKMEAIMDGVGKVAEHVAQIMGGMGYE